MPQKASMNNNARKYNRYNEVDERILALFAENKEKAFRLLYDTYYLPLCLYSVLMFSLLIVTVLSADTFANTALNVQNMHISITKNLIFGGLATKRFQSSFLFIKLK